MIERPCDAQGNVKYYSFFIFNGGFLLHPLKIRYGIER